MKGVANLQKMLKAAKEMQEKLQQELTEMKVEGEISQKMGSLGLGGKIPGLF